MSMEIYECTIKQLEVYRELKKSECQIKEEKTKDAKSSLAVMRKKCGLERYEEKLQNILKCLLEK